MGQTWMKENEVQCTVLINEWHRQTQKKGNPSVPTAVSGVELYTVRPSVSFTAKYTILIHSPGLKFINNYYNTWLVLLLKSKNYRDMYKMYENRQAHFPFRCCHGFCFKHFQKFRRPCTDESRWKEEFLSPIWQPIIEDLAVKMKNLGPLATY